MRCWHLAVLCVNNDDSPSYHKLYDYNNKDERLEVEYKLQELKEYYKTFGVSIQDIVISGESSIEFKPVWSS